MGRLFIDSHLLLLLLLLLMLLLGRRRLMLRTIDLICHIPWRGIAGVARVSAVLHLLLLLLWLLLLLVFTGTLADQGRSVRRESFQIFLLSRFGFLFVNLREDLFIYVLTR